jgi:hypothetical protein
MWAVVVLLAGCGCGEDRWWRRVVVKAAAAEGTVAGRWAHGAMRISFFIL